MVRGVGGAAAEGGGLLRDSRFVSCDPDVAVASAAFRFFDRERILPALKEYSQSRLERIVAVVE